jgi:outer membrane protein OmpA-like peptidoglycan-associated protein
LSPIDAIYNPFPPFPLGSTGQESSLSVGISSAEVITTSAPEMSPTLSPEELAAPNARQSAGAAPALLSQNEIDPTREDVVKRINAVPGVTAERKTNLIEKMRKARLIERLTVIPFDRGRITLRRAAADEMVKAFATPEMRDKLGDPTIVLVVAGYADTGGRADLNLHFSQERAENVGRILKEQAKLLNAIQTIGMGGTELLDTKRPDQNRAVEVWAVVPL